MKSNNEHSKNKENNINKSIKKSNRIKMKIKSYLVLLTMFLESVVFAVKGWREIRKSSVDYSTVVSTFGYFGPHLLAAKLKRKRKDLKWIADFRDPVIDFGRYIQWCCDLYCSYVTKHADDVVTVSEGIKEVLITKNRDAIHIIENGYDEDDLSNLPSIEQLEDNKFHLCYTGSVYPRLDIPPLFKAIEELVREEKVDINQTQINYAGKGFEVFKTYADGTGLVNRIVNFGYVDREVSLSIQNNSHILLLGTWNFKVSPDVMTGKIYEYMMMKKPILVFVNGDRVDGKMKRLISEFELGFCYETANNKNDFVLLKNYIFEVYKDFLERKSITLSHNSEIENFSYKSISKNTLC